MPTPPKKFRFPAPLDIPLNKKDDYNLMTEVFADIAETIRKYGGEATTHDTPDTGMPTIVAILSLPEMAAAIAETLFQDKWHKRLSPQLRRNIIHNMVSTYTITELPSKNETLQ